ncbi:hypothetical protein [Vampirovibrio sp.]|uniref:hypothetical protein n=1 Tax=Vampirovibrio sp. TaxID=2717857 RepID=UPI0035947A84
MEPPSKKSNPSPQSTDPFLYAASLNSFITERNPFQVLTGDMLHLIKTVVNLGKNRKIAQQRIDQMQAQVEKVEGDIAYVNPKSMGNRLDKFR